MLQSPICSSADNKVVWYLGGVLLLALLLTSCTDNKEGPSNVISKNIPQNIIVKSGTRAVTLNWGGVVGASAYTVYWSNQPGVTVRTGYPLQTVKPELIHDKLSNGVTYYYVITANQSKGESSASIQVSALPQAAVPASAGSVAAQSGDGRISVSWASAAGADRYNLYWSTQAGVTAAATRVDNTVSPFVHSGLKNGQDYYYIVVAENEQGAGATSSEVQGQPTEALPTAPVIVDAVVTANAVELSWLDVSTVAPGSTTEYDLFWNNIGNVKSNDARIRKVTSPYIHAPLSGENYYYRLQARNSTGSSSLSNSLHVQPPGTQTIAAVGTLAPAPGVISISIEDGQLSLSWSRVAGASAYNLYWSDASTGVLGNKITNIQTPYTHIQLNNGTTYRYALSAINDHGESALSVESKGAPQVIIPGVPAGVTASSGDEKITVRWIEVENAKRYVVYLTDIESDRKQSLLDATSPLRLDVDSGVVNGRTYKLEVAAVNVGGTSAVSAGALATPQEPPPLAPTILTAAPSDREVLLQWPSAGAQDPLDVDEAVTDYRVYFSTRAGVTPSNGTPVAASIQQETDNQGKTIWRLRHTGLSNGTRYYYIVTAENVGGESPPSDEVWARPQVRILNMPSNVWTEADDKQVVVNFNEAEAIAVDFYNLYWSKSPTDAVDGVGRSNIRVITNVRSGYAFIDNDNRKGDIYYFRLSAVNAAGESALSSEVSAHLKVLVPTTPQITASVGLQSQVSLAWTTVPDADNYIVYWSTEANIDPSVSARIDEINQAEYVHTSLTNGQVYYYQIAAVNAGGQSSLSDLAVVMPQWDAPAKPVKVVVTPGDGEVYVSWPSNLRATSYTLYWHVEPLPANSDPLTNWSKRTAVDTGLRLTGLSNGQVYRFHLQAHNAGGDSTLSSQLSAVPEQAAPLAPLGFSAAAGDAQVSLNWFTRTGEIYTLYWTTDVNLPSLPLSNWNQLAAKRPVYIHQDEAIGVPLSNGSTYRYQLIASHGGGTSPPIAEVRATPAVPALNAPQYFSAVGGDQEVFLNWLPPTQGSGPYTYTIYWSDTAGQGISGAAISGISNSTYVQTDRNNSQPYYYVVTATDSGSGLESGASLPTSAIPQALLPGQVVGVRVDPGDGQNIVAWQAQAIATQYLVEWSPQVDANNVLQGNINSTAVLAPKLQYVHPGLKNGETIYYQVIAQNYNGPRGDLQDGQKSGTVAGTPLVDSNQAPQIVQGASTIVEMDEDSNPNAFSLDLDAIDNDADSLSWRIATLASNGTASVIGADKSAAVTYNPNLNWDSGDAFTIEVEDGKGGVDAITVNVTILPINDAPIFNALLTDQTNVDAAMVSLDASATDVDNTQLIYRSLGLPAGLAIDVNTGQISGRLSATASSNSPYTVTLTVDDNSGTVNAQQNLTLVWTVSSQAADPSKSTASISPVATSVIAGTDIIITVTAKDSAGTTIATGGEIVALTILGANANLSAGGPLLATDNADGTYTMMYTAQLAGVDNYQLTIDQGSPVAIAGNYSKTITTNNIAPTNITLNNTTIPENSANATVIGDLAAVDTSGDTHTYSFVAPNTDAGGRFSIVGNQLQVANGVLLDFEIASSHTISVQTQDQGALLFRRDFTINVSDMPEVVSAITVNNAAGQVTLSWTAKASEQYEIHRALVTGFTPDITTLISTTALGVSSITDPGLTNGTLYYYRLITLQGVNKSSPSMTVEGMPTAPLDVPVGLSAVSGNAQVALTWTAISSLTYEVHRGGTSDFIADSTTLIKTTAVGIGGYTDSAVSNSTLYFYRLIAVNGAVKSPPTTSVLGDPVTATAPPPPTLSLSGNRSAIQLNLVSAVAPDSYKVYFNTTGNVSKADALAYRGTASNYSHVALTNMQLYYYRASAVTGGQEGLLSAEQVSFPFSVKTSWVKSYPKHPSGLIRDVMFTGSQYIAVGWENLTITSPDRVTWTSRITGSDNAQRNRRVAHDNKGVVIMATTGGMYRSVDHGITWARVSPLADLNPTFSVQRVFYINSSFVAFIGNNYLTSPDGLVWTRLVMRGNPGNDIILEGTSYYSLDINDVYRSNNGVNWSSVYRTPVATDSLEKLSAANGNFYIRGRQNPSGGVYTLRCATFSTCSSTPTGGYVNIAYSPILSQYYRIAGGLVYTSTAGLLSWTAKPLDMVAPQPLFGLEWIENAATPHLMAFGDDGTLGSSTDGLTWSRNSFNGYINDLIWDGTRYVGVSSKFVATSSDGLTWARNNNSYDLRHIEYDGLGYIAVGNENSKAAIVASTDATNWTAVYIDTGADTFLWSSASNGTYRVAVGSGGSIFTDAPDGVWKSANLNPVTTNTFYSVAWNGVAFLAIPNGTPTQVYRSTDGVNWTISYDTGEKLRTALIVKDGIFYVAGTNKLLRSPDGLAWSTTVSDITANLNWDGTMFWSGTSHVSPDGIHWNRVAPASNGTVLTTPTRIISFSTLASNPGIFR